jgi:hypothetical protein
MEVRIVVVHTLGDLLHHARYGIDIDVGCEPRQVGVARFEFFQRGAQYVEFGGVDHSSGPLPWSRRAYRKNGRASTFGAVTICRWT